MGHVESNGEVTFAAPKGEIKFSYFDLIMKQMYHLGMMISQSSSGISDSRIPLMVSFIISHVPQKKLRQDMRDDLKAALEARLEGVVDSEDRTLITIETYVEVIGNMADYLEKYMGTTQENRLGFIGVNVGDKDAK